MRRLCLALGLLLLSALPAAAVGFQWAVAPDGDNAPLQVAVWYPSDSPTTDNVIGPYDMDVALNGNVAAGRHPLVVMSHGTGGMALNSFDTAMALAQAGFVVASVAHAGDNYRDQSNSFTRQNFVDRPRHVSRVVDFMLGNWPGRGSVDSSRIGMFGHSAGGTTALIAIGGVADMTLVVAFCRDHPDDWGCERARQRGPIQVETAGPPVSGRDVRIKAAVLAAPALAVSFAPNGLAGVSVPVQLWVAAEDVIVRDASVVATLLPTPPDYRLIANGGHFAFLSPCREILLRAAVEICADPAGFDRAAFLGAFHQAVIAFYRERLQ